MTKRTPTLSPAQAIARHASIGGADFTNEGFTYVLDGPRGCPVSEMASFATDQNDETQWFISGEFGDAVTDASTWVQP